MAGIIKTSKLTQVGFVVRDIEAAKRRYAEFFGVPVPEYSDAGDYKITRTTVAGKPAPDANSYLAFFDVGDGVQLELIQPNEAPSTWRDYLETHGEGIHHIAFVVENMEEAVASCERFGMTVVQRGKYGDGSGEYCYLDAQDSLKCVIELLQNY